MNKAQLLVQTRTESDNGQRGVAAKSAAGWVQKKKAVNKVHEKQKSEQHGPDKTKRGDNSNKEKDKIKRGIETGKAVAQSGKWEEPDNTLNGHGLPRMGLQKNTKRGVGKMKFNTKYSLSTVKHEN